MQFFLSAGIHNDTTIAQLTKVGWDGAQYIYSAESLFQGGDHSYHKTDQGPLTSNFTKNGDYDVGIFYTFRTPGYAFIYLPLRLFFSFNNTLLAILMLQTILNGWMKYLICQMACSITKNKTQTLIIGLITVNSLFIVGSYNHIFMTEALAGFFLVAGIYLSYKAEKSKTNYQLLMAGILLLIAILLRPFLFPIIGCIGIAACFKNNQFKLLGWLNKGTLFLVLPTVLFLGGWTIRNYQKTGEVIILSKTLGWENHVNKGFKEMFHLVHNIGEPHEWWISKHLTTWYLKKDSKLDIKSFDRIAALPDDKIALITASKQDYQNSIDSLQYDLQTRKNFELQAENKLKTVNKYINTNFNYALTIPFETAFIFTSSPVSTPFLIMCGIIGGIILIFRRSTNKYFKILLGIQFFLIIFFSAMGINEKREVFFPILIGLLPGIVWLNEIISRRRLGISLLILGISFILAITDLSDYINF